MPNLQRDVHPRPSPTSATFSQTRDAQHGVNPAGIGRLIDAIKLRAQSPHPKNSFQQEALGTATTSVLHAAQPGKRRLENTAAASEVSPKKNSLHAASSPPQEAWQTKLLTGEPPKEMLLTQAHAEALTRRPPAPPLSSSHQTIIKKVLLNLQYLGKNFSPTKPDGDETRISHKELETIINFGMLIGRFSRGARGAFNQVFALSLKGNTLLRHKLTKEHYAMVQKAKKAKNLTHRICHNLRAVLVHIQAHGKRFSPDIPEDDDEHISHQELEKTINDGMRKATFLAGARGAFNIAFGLHLKGDTLLRDKLTAEHTALLANLPADKKITASYRYYIIILFVHLQSNGECFSPTLPEGDDKHISHQRLAKIINDGSRNTGTTDNYFHPGTRAAVNDAFGLSLRGDTLLRDKLTSAHEALLENLPKGNRTKHDQQHYYHVLRVILVHLQNIGKQFSPAPPADDNSYIAHVALEEKINEGIRRGFFHESTLTIFNRTFSLALKTKKFPRDKLTTAHEEMLKNTLADKNINKRNYITLRTILVDVQNTEKNFSPSMPGNDPKHVSHAELIKTINESTEDKDLVAQTCAIFEQIFGLSLPLTD